MLLWAVGCTPVQGSAYRPPCTHRPTGLYTGAWGVRCMLYIAPAYCLQLALLYTYVCDTYSAVKCIQAAYTGACGAGAHLRGIRPSTRSTRGFSRNHREWHMAGIIGNGICHVNLQRHRARCCSTSKSLGFYTAPVSYRPKPRELAGFTHPRPSEANPTSPPPLSPDPLCAPTLPPIHARPPPFPCWADFTWCRSSHQ